MSIPAVMPTDVVRFPQAENAVMDLTLYNEVDFFCSYIWEDNTEAGIDLTGISFDFKVRRRAESATVYIHLTDVPVGEEGIWILSPTPPYQVGSFVLYIKRDRLQSITPAEYVQSLICLRTGVWTRIWGGKFSLNWGVSR